MNGDSNDQRPTAPTDDFESIQDLSTVTSGRWIVHTLTGSRHLFDLDAGTVHRFPAPEAAPLQLPDIERQIRTIDRVQVGDAGYYTMHSPDWLIDYLWHQTSTVLRIVREK